MERRWKQYCSKGNFRITLVPVVNEFFNTSECNDINESNKISLRNEINKNNEISQSDKIVKSGKDSKLKHTQPSTLLVLYKFLEYCQLYE